MLTITEKFCKDLVTFLLSLCTLCENADTIFGTIYTCLWFLIQITAVTSFSVYLSTS